MKNDILVTTPLTLIDGVSGVLPVTRVQKRPIRHATTIKLPRRSSDRKEKEVERKKEKEKEREVKESSERKGNDKTECERTGPDWRRI